MGFDAVALMSLVHFDMATLRPSSHLDSAQEI